MGKNPAYTDISLYMHLHLQTHTHSLFVQSCFVLEEQNRMKLEAKQTLNAAAIRGQH